jgi:nucleotide-binding universal stress UspA family protein
VDVAAATGASIHVLHVIETTSLGPDVRSDPAARDPDAEARASDLVTETVGAAAAALAERVDDGATGDGDAESEADVEDRVVGEVRAGAAASVVLDVIEETGVDLAVLGTHGRTDFSRYVLGGVSAKLIRTAPVPVAWARDADDDGT